jgi:UDP-N-acetylmuramoylalanine--D-glutamate ligase
LQGSEVALPQRVLVLGLARSGQAAALALRRREIDVIGVDAAQGLDVGRLREAGVELHLGTEEERLLDAVETVIKSPGVPGEAPLLAAARARGIPVWSEVELGSRLLPNPILGVTGTNGKTTTSELLGVMLGAPVAGNVGRALTDLDGQVEPEQVVVCEVSSFQLEDVHEFRPRVAVLLNLEPDHLDRHGSLEAYRDAKLRIFENQREEDTAIVPRGFDEVPGRGRRIEFEGGDPLPAEPKIPGAHNRENAVAATAAARALGVDDSRIAGALQSFAGVAHRLEPVAEAGGVRYVNDSKATNTAAARRAVAAFDAPLHVILGGRGKEESYTELALDLVGRAQRAYLIGETATALATALELAGVDHVLSGDLETAVRSAAQNARPGDVVLLAPACASYDQFHDFEERGDAFRRLARELTA